MNDVLIKSIKLPIFFIFNPHVKLEYSAVVNYVMPNKDDMNRYKLMGIDMQLKIDYEVRSSIVKEITQKLYDEISKQITYIDKEHSLSDFCINEHIKNIKYYNVIMSPELFSQLMQYGNDILSKDKIGDIENHHGNLYNYNGIYYDKLILTSHIHPWNDTLILNFDNVYYNMDIIKTSVRNTTTYEVRYGISIPHSEAIVLIENENSPRYSDFIIDNRRKIINNIAK